MGISGVTVPLDCPWLARPPCWPPPRPARRVSRTEGHRQCCDTGPHSLTQHTFIPSREGRWESRSAQRGATPTPDAGGPWGHRVRLTLASTYLCCFFIEVKITRQNPRHFRVNSQAAAHSQCWAASPPRSRTFSPSRGGRHPLSGQSAGHPRPQPSLCCLFWTLRSRGVSFSHLPRVAVLSVVGFTNRHTTDGQTDGSRVVWAPALGDAVGVGCISVPAFFLPAEPRGRGGGVAGCRSHRPRSAVAAVTVLCSHLQRLHVRSRLVFADPCYFLAFGFCWFCSRPGG